MEMLNTDLLLEELGLTALQEKFDRLFPAYQISMEDILEKLFAGDLPGAGQLVMQGFMDGMAMEMGSIREMLVLLLTMGIIAAFFYRLVMVFDRQQTADMSMYVLYVLQAGILMRCFEKMAALGGDTIGKILEFVKLMLPAYLLTLTLSGGRVTEKTYTSILLGIILLVEYVLAGICLPLCYIYVLLSLVNVVWGEERLVLFMGLIKKIMRLLLKGSLGVVMAVSVVQNILTPSLDRISKGTLEKLISLLPGIGGIAEGTIELMLGTVSVLKNGVGILILVLLLGICAAPLLYLYLVAFLLELSAALVGVVSGSAITMPIHRTAESIYMILKITATAMLLFLLSISMVTLSV